MPLTLQHGLLKKIHILLLVPLFIAAAPVVCLAQSQLAPGDVVIVSVSAGSQPKFAFVPLANLEQGTIIRFTDNAYRNDVGLLDNTEGGIHFTAAGPISAGTVVWYNGQSSKDFSGRTLSLSADGDNIIVYQSTGTDVRYLYGIGWSTEPAGVWKFNAASIGDGHSDVPPGLSEANNTLLSLGAAPHWTYATSRTNATALTELKNRISDQRNWSKMQGEQNLLPSSFEVTESVQVSFATRQITVSTADSVILLPVKFEGGKEGAVTVEVAFNQEPSLNSSQSGVPAAKKTVQFSDANNNTENIGYIEVPINKLEGNAADQTETFRLVNSSYGSLIEPRTIRAVIKDRPLPAVAINEINASPGDDADGNGIIDSSGDEFIEFVNTRKVAVDISGWMFSDDGSTIRHVFPKGTVLPPGGALVLFSKGYSSVTRSLGGALVQYSNRSETLHLATEGDSPTLITAEGGVVDSYRYGQEAGRLQSVTRNPDITGRFTVHTLSAKSERLRSSPGRMIDGSSFGLAHVHKVRGREGWRLVATPGQAVRLDGFLEDFAIQGISGSAEPAKEPSVYFWDEISGGSLVSPSSVANPMVPGMGYLFYYFKPATTEGESPAGNGSPQMVIDKSESPATVTVPVSATDANNNGLIDGNEGFNLLGNPFGVRISVGAVLDALEEVDKSLHRNVLVWDSDAGGGNGAFKILTEEDFIAPFQAFFIRFSREVRGTAVLNKSEMQPQKIEEIRAEKVTNAGFSIDFRLNDGLYYDIYKVDFAKDGKLELGANDAFKLPSLNTAAINLFARVGENALSRNVLPLNLKSTIEMPLLIQAPENRASFTLSWKVVDKVPDGWSIILHDRELNQRIDLTSQSAYEFTLAKRSSHGSNQNKISLIHQPAVSGNDPDARFVLTVRPAGEADSGQDMAAESVKLNPNYPNPFNSVTTIPFELATESEIRLSIWNIVGQKVVTLIDGVREAGPDEIVWNASDMPSGIYIAQLEVGGEVYIRKMTLIKQ